jgi:hypothetical protein
MMLPVSQVDGFGKGGGSGGDILNYLIWNNSFVRRLLWVVAVMLLPPLIESHIMLISTGLLFCCSFREPRGRQEFDEMDG